MLFLLSTGLDTDLLSILLRHTKSYQPEIILSVPISVNVKHVHKSPKFPFWEWNAFGVLWSRISISQPLGVPAVPVSHLVTNCILCQVWILTAPILPVLYVIFNVFAEIPYSHLLVPKIFGTSPCHNHRLCCLLIQSIAYAFTDSYPLALGLTAHTVLYVAWSLG